MRIFRILADLRCATGAPFLNYTARGGGNTLPGAEDWLATVLIMTNPKLNAPFTITSYCRSLGAFSARFLQQLPQCKLRRLQTHGIIYRNV